MKFLIKEEWERILAKLTFNKTNTQKETRVEKIFFEISQRIKDLAIKKSFTHMDYGIAMTLFHYYIFFNDIRNIDGIEICFACLYMTSKIQFYNIPLNEFVKDYKEYIKDKPGYDKKPNPDFIKYEIQLYSQLGYDLDIETPYQCFYQNFYSTHINNNNKEKIDKVKHFCYNLINDTYTRPLSIYYHPKIIYLSCLIYSLKFLEYNEFDINKILQNEKEDLVAECMEKIYQIYSRFIEDNSNNVNTTNNTSNSNNDKKMNDDNK